jgi:hypothetical protein
MEDEEILIVRVVVEKLPASSNFVGNQLCKGGKETIPQHWNYASFTAVLTW